MRIKILLHSLYNGSYNINIHSFYYYMAVIPRKPKIRLRH